MINIKYNKKYVLITYLFEFFLGTYIASSRLINVTENDLTSAFITARESNYLDLTSNMFDMQMIISVLNIIITIPILSYIFTKNYDTKCCFLATRKEKYSHMYFGQIFSLFKLSFTCESLYTFGILTFVLIETKTVEINSQLFLSLILSIVNSTIILFIFVLLGTLISTLVGDKIGMLCMITISSILTSLLFVLPTKLKQYNIISWYYIKEFMNNKEIFNYNACVYYFFAFLLIIFIIILSLNVLKKKDFL